jgi:hypothetical protein
MKASIRSAALFIALVIVMGTACAGTTITAAQDTEVGVINPAPPGACQAAIVRLENALSEALARGRPLTIAPVSAGAMLHHQPTRDSVAKARSESVKRVEVSLATARELRSEGKRSECVSMLEKIARSVGIR